MSLTHFLQNLREEVAMDVDEPEDGAQRVRHVQDYGIEVDFADIDDEEREVCILGAALCGS